MKKQRNRGSLPLMILSALVAGECHGYRITTKIREGSLGVLSYREGTLYPMLHRLKEDGLLSSRREIVDGRARRYYKLTAAGKRAVVVEQKNWASYKEAVDNVLASL
ncbi:helix-turn-helix transcriptional regulator [bacterium]|nr:helix-turn-helix transcriptional regulator [bacterium]